MTQQTWFHDVEVALYFGAGVWAGTGRPIYNPWIQGIGSFILALLSFRLYPRLHALVGRIPFLREQSDVR